MLSRVDFAPLPGVAFPNSSREILGRFVIVPAVTSPAESHTEILELRGAPESSAA